MDTDRQLESPLFLAVTAVTAVTMTHLPDEVPQLGQEVAGGPGLSAPGSTVSLGPGTVVDMRLCV